jgi:hypothetical protein
MTLFVRNTPVVVRERSGDNQRPIAGATIHIEVRVKENGNPGTQHHTATTNRDGRAIFEALPIGKFRVWGERSDGSPIDIVAIDGLQIAPGARPWLREKNLQEFGTSFDILALPPPIMLNFRLPDDQDANKQWRLRRSTGAAESETWYRLNDDELEYLRDNGNNATILVHGYNVALGEPPTGTLPERLPALQVGQGRTTDDREAHGATRIGRTNATTRGYVDPLRLKDVMRSVDDEAFDHPHQRMASALNGSQTWAWHLGMEGNLNRAAGGDNKVDYTRYQRVVGVTWSGNRGSIDFWGAELAANQTGRLLVPLLCQLADEGIAVNLIAHSLGARVVLTALNLMAQLPEPRTVDQLFLWEPAVTENALGEPDDYNEADFAADPSEFPDPLGHERFPDAAGAAERIVVLYSQRDNILGPQPASYDVDIDTEGEGDYAPESPEEQERIMEEIGEYEWVAGIYTERYRLSGHISQRYDAGWMYRVPINGADDIERRRAHFRRQLTRESERIHYNADQLGGEVPLPKYDQLLPWAREIAFDYYAIEALVNRLAKLASNGPGLPRTQPRAMGWAGPNADNPQIERLRESGKLEEVNQTGQLATHSAMWFPDQRLFEQIVRAQVWERFMKEIGFGTYS